MFAKFLASKVISWTWRQFMQHFQGKIILICKLFCSKLLKKSNISYRSYCRYQGPRGLRRESAAARLLKLWVCCEFCVLSGRGLCVGLITRPGESYRLCCFLVCDLETSEWGDPGHFWPQHHREGGNLFIYRCENWHSWVSEESSSLALCCF